MLSLLSIMLMCSMSLWYVMCVLHVMYVIVVMNSLRLRPWWRCNPKIIPTNHFIWEMFRNRNRYKTKKYRRVMLNHIQHNHALVTKNGLYLSLKDYCPSAGIDLATIVPQTFYLSSVQGNEDRNTELEEFTSYNSDEADIIWILKPAFAANQGCGIKVVTGLDECLAVIGCQPHSPRKDMIASETEDENADDEGNCEEGEGEQEEGVAEVKKRVPRITEWIVQRYMKEPLLIRGRKFDIRCFVLLVMKQSSSSKVLPDGSKEDCTFKAYMYKDGYVRTSGKKYNLSNLSDKETHLTNDAVQKKAASYGKYESANKLTYDQFQESINQDYPSAPSCVVRSKILPQIEYQVRI
jgi:tubulin---tyrosine ligase